MRHHFLDHYWTISSPIHRMDPRLKIVAAGIILLAVVLTPNGRFVDIALFVPLLIALLAVSRLPAGAIARRMLIVLPLVVLIALSLPFVRPGRPILTFNIFVPVSITDAGIASFASVVIKATAAVWIMTLLTATTGFRDLVAGMQELKFPTILTTMMGFMYRYIFLFIDEAERLNTGRRSRSFGNRTLLAIRGFGWMLSSLLLRSFERGERIYQAMCARGFDGRFETMTDMKITVKDASYCAAFIVLVIIIKIIGRYYG